MRDHQIAQLLQQQEEERKRQADEAQRQMQLTLMMQPKQQQQQQSGGPMGGMNPMSMMQGQSGGGNGIGGLFGGGMTPTASAQASGTVGAHAAPYAGSGASGAGGGGSMMGGLAANPYAWIAAAVLANEKYQNNTNNRKSEAFPLEWGLEGRAFYKDAPKWGAKADKVIPGMGSDIGIAGDLSSPADMFRGSTYSDLWKNAKKGGILGGLVRKIF